MNPGKAFHPASGFTLLEVLVALVLLALFTLSTWRALDAVLTAEAHAREDLARWQTLARVLGRMESDLENAQTISHPRSGEADAAQAFVGNAASMQFTRSTQEGALAHITWQIREGALMRGLNGGTAQTVLAALPQGEWKYLDTQGQWVAQWPPLTSSPRGITAGSPRAVEFVFTSVQGHTLRRVFRVQ